MTLLADFEVMARIRAFEERVSRHYREQEIPGFVHVSIGQEAVAAGVCGILERRDLITTTHRGHGHCLAKGMDSTAMMAELFGRVTGTCGGRGGSMHIADPALGVLGANGIVGAGLALATGAGLASLRRRTGAVSVAFAGEGTLHGGAFHEAMSLAVLWDVPVVFVIEDNRYAEFTRSESLWRGAPVVDRARAYGVHDAQQVDGNDVEAVRAAAARLVAAARGGAGPSLLHALTYRVHGHYEGDPLAYRDAAEHDARLADDPLVLALARLDERGQGEQARRALRVADAEMDRAVAAARSAPFPDPADVLLGVHA